MPITIEWPASFLSESEWLVQVVFKDETTSLDEVSIDLLEPSEDGPLKFVIYSDHHRSEYELKIFTEEEGNGFSYNILAGSGASFKIGGRQKPLEDWAADDPPIIRFADNSYLENNLHIRPGDQTIIPYSREALTAWDWSGVNLRKESQREEKRADSIQYRVIANLKAQDYEILFDDDGSGEAADVVAIRVSDRCISVELYHCKYSHHHKPGVRVTDLYEVCGSPKKYSRKENVIKLTPSLEKKRGEENQSGKQTRF